VQTLDYFNSKNEEISRNYDIPVGATGVKVQVDDYKDCVLLTIDGRETTLTVKGARDMALALRQSANRVEREMFDHLGKKPSKKRRAANSA
jgi:hypothetical protein